MSRSSTGGRKLRQKERKFYDFDIDDEEIEGKRMFSIEEKLASNNYNTHFVKEMRGLDFDFSHIQENGFNHPVVVKDKTGLGLRVPSKNFKISDVKMCVGSRRQLDVMDVNTQKGLSMTMKEWTEYYESTERDRLLNVISLEFSQTKLENYVEQPSLVQKLDWVDIAWPRYLKNLQRESSNILEKMMYPKVQKYCLMSVGGCYTDFHIDMCGTSVWYHIVRGNKVFWLIPPTETNLSLYESWVLSGKQGDMFFADLVEAAQRITLEKGWTFFIPTGWIHAVYTPCDSLVFGGNFLHSFNIPMQLRITEIENKTHVPQKFRYPFFTELHWYLVERYVNCITGRTFRIKPDAEVRYENGDSSSDISDAISITSGSSSSSSNKKEDFISPRSPIYQEHSYVCPPEKDLQQNTDNLNDISEGNISPRSSRNVFADAKWFLTKDATPEKNGVKTLPTDLIKPVSVKLENCMLKIEKKPHMQGPTSTNMKGSHLTEWELKGLNILVQWLEALPSSKKSIPADIPDSSLLLAEMKQILLNHKIGDVKLSITGEPILKWTTEKVPPKVKKQCMINKPRDKGRIRSKKTSSGNRHRRIRCKTCEPCTRADCRDCNFCADMKKYGGPSRMKQSCIQRQCISPLLPANATCILCNQTSSESPSATMETLDDYSARLMECCVCWEILHPACLKSHSPHIQSRGILNEDLPSSWQCAKCCDAGRVGHFMGRKTSLKDGSSQSLSSSSNDSSSAATVILSPSELEDIPALTDDNKKENRSVLHNNRTKREYSDSSDSSSEWNSQKSTRLKRSRNSTPQIDQARKKSTKLHTLKKQPVNNGYSVKSQVSRSGREVDDEGGGGWRLRGRENLYFYEDSSDSDDLYTPSHLTTKHSSSSKTKTNSGQLKSDQRHETRKKVKCKREKKMSGWEQVLMNGQRNGSKNCTPEYLCQTTGIRHALNRKLWLRIFHFMSHKDLLVSQQVCRAWRQWCLDPTLWKTISLDRQHLRPESMLHVVKCEPRSLDLSWTNVSQNDLMWLMHRLPDLKHLNLTGNSWAAVCGLCCAECPLLNSLDISWVVGLYDNCLKDLFSPPTDSEQPGLNPCISRLVKVQKLILCGGDFSDHSMHYIGAYLTSLKVLNMSYCSNLTNEALCLLASDDYDLTDRLQKLELNGCYKLTDACFDSLVKFNNLEEIMLQSCPNISFEACKRFIEKHPAKHYQMREVHRIERVN